MSIAAGLTALGRRSAESIMTSTCRITKTNGAATTDRTTGIRTDPTAIVYEGPCRLRWARDVVVEVEAQRQAISKQNPELWLPVGAPGSADVDTDMQVQITSNPLDPAAEAMTFRIRGIHAQSHSVSRRFSIEVES